MHDPMSRFERHPASRWFGFCGSLFAAASVALAAYASHAVDGEPRARLMLAAVFAFGHGVALAAMAGHGMRRLKALALAAMLLGVVVFCGSLVAHVFWGLPTRLAPVGGMLLIAGWVLFALHSLRR
jgi:uncharacterized membrane protein YgdD (TMEM256/DUF423 family)